MNIIKPQKLKLKELEVSNIKEVQENEQKEYLKFENEECSGIQLYENEFEHCTFSNINMQEATIEKAYPNIFVVKYEENNRNVTYSYTDVLTRTVEVEVFDGDSYSPLIPPPVPKQRRMSL